MKTKYTSHQRLVFTTLAAVLAALTFVVIYFTAVPIPGIGIFHVGDFFIYIAAALLPLPYAMAVGIVGAGMTNVLNPMLLLFAPFTVVIKSLNCLPFNSKNSKILTKRNIIALFVSGAITIVGYFFARWVVMGIAEESFVVGFGHAVRGILINAMQATGSAILFLIISFVLDKANIKRSLY